MRNFPFCWGACELAACESVGSACELAACDSDGATFELAACESVGSVCELAACDSDGATFELAACDRTVQLASCLLASRTEVFGPSWVSGSEAVLIKRPYLNVHVLNIKGKVDRPQTIDFWRRSNRMSVAFW